MCPEIIDECQPHFIAILGARYGWIPHGDNVSITEREIRRATDLHAAAYEPAFTFIEPDYAIQVGSQFTYGSSQHPLGRVSAGETLIEVLRSS